MADSDALRVWAPDALLRAYLDAVVDALVREQRGAPVATKSVSRSLKLARAAEAKPVSLELEPAAACGRFSPRERRH